MLLLPLGEAFYSKHVNTQFRAYPFYKAPILVSYKILSNLIVFLTIGYGMVIQWLIRTFKAVSLLLYDLPLYVPRLIAEIDSNLEQLP